MDCGFLQDGIDIQRDQQESKCVSVSEQLEVASGVSLLLHTFQKYR